MDILPKDYIDVSTLLGPPKKTLKSDIKEIVRRFGRQLFLAKHVLWALREEEHYRIKDPDNLYASIRPAVLLLVKDGEIEVVSCGKRGIPSVYRNIEEPAK